MTHHTTLVQRCRKTNSLLADEFAAAFRQLENERDGERECREKLAAILIEKDAAMGVLFDRMRAAGVDFSDLIP